MYGTGKAKLDIKELTAGSVSMWTLVYETGEYGIDDSGEILIARRDVCDSDIPQFINPLEPGYIKVYGNTEAELAVRYVPDRYIRPWKSCISIKVSGGSLKKGDSICLQFGASPGEGLGYRIQTFAEEEHMFKVLVDCAGSGNFYEIDRSPVIKITGGYMDKVEAVAPSLVEARQAADINFRALDSWGNIASKCNEKIKIRMGDFEKELELYQGMGKLSGYCFEKEGLYQMDIKDNYGNIVGKCNPVKCVDAAAGTNLYWGDMHGQTKETVGTGTLDQYFSSARDKAFIDFTAWQGNDFQVTDKTWKNVCEKVKKHHEPGRFITFLGYEWSGTTPAGGDYNIYYLKDDQPIHRSYHWQIGMERRDGSERNPLSKLWKEFEGREDVMGIPHVGGRYGNLDFCDESFVRLLEIHSHHGTFEWFFEDALKKGLKLGIIAASDDHTCRPGLSYPTRVTSRGFVSFDVVGGYTGVYARELTREALWEAFKNRHCYGTTGERIILDVRCGDKMMGDAFSVNGTPKIDIYAAGTCEISEIEIKRNVETVYLYSDEFPRKENTIKLQWSGVRIKSRSKKTLWDGTLTVENGRIISVRQYAFNQPDEGVTQISNQIIKWKSSTSGDIDGIEVELDYDENTRLTFSSGPISFTTRISEIKRGRVVKNAGGINQKVEILFSRKGIHKKAELSFEDKNIKDGLNAYWVKVIQKDGHMAWSSPMYITK